MNSTFILVDYKKEFKSDDIKYLKFNDLTHAYIKEHFYDLFSVEPNPPSPLSVISRINYLSIPIIT